MRRYCAAVGGSGGGQSIKCWWSMVVVNGGDGQVVAANGGGDGGADDPQNHRNALCSGGAGWLAFPQHVAFQYFWYVACQLCVMLCWLSLTCIASVVILSV